MYADLMGAFGRDARYRPKRYRVRELLSQLARPHLRVEGREYPLVDLSSNGASLLAPAEISWPLGESVNGTLILHGLEAQRLSARVVRTEREARGLRVGLGLVRGFLDLEAAKQLDAGAQLEQALTKGPGHGTVPEGFRAIVAEAAHLVQFYRAHLEPHEAGARARGEEAVCELAARAYNGLTPLYAELREKASRAALSCFDDPSVLRAAKAYTTTVLTPLLLSAPMIARAYQKPLGYPGDYQVMLFYYYADAFEGDTAFAKALHRLFVQHPLSAGVCSRKDYVVDHMRRELEAHEQHGAQAPFAVTSLGCGPAMEVSSFIDQRRDWKGSIHWRLIDQEPRTLQIAHEGAQRALASASGHGSVECLNLAFGQLLKNPQLLEQGGPQHFVYSTGLFDYLNKPTAQRLISALFDCLAPGGEMLIANAKGPNEYFFCPEFVLDWSLIYRTRDEMRELASVLPHGTQIEIDLEPGGAYWFLRVRKGLSTSRRS